MRSAWRHGIAAAVLAHAWLTGTAPVGAVGPAVLTSGQTADPLLGPIHWILLIDTSASMVGAEPESRNIFPEVKKVLAQFITAARDGDSLTVFVFDTGSALKLSVDLKNDGDRRRAIAALAGLQARGLRTHTGAALKHGLESAASTAAGDATRPIAIILLTDGREDVRGIADPVRIPDVVKLIPDTNVPFVFYVSLGTQVDAELEKFVEAVKKKANDQGRAAVNRHPHAGGLAAAVDGIRNQIPRARLATRPSSLDFGEIAAGGSGRASLTVSSRVSTRVAVRIASLPADLTLTRPEPVEVAADRPATLALALRVATGAAAGSRSFVVRLQPESGLQPIDVRAEVTIVPPPPAPLVIEPTPLGLGRIQPGTVGGPYTLGISTPAAVTLRITLVDVPAGHKVVGLPATLRVDPAQRGQLRFWVHVADDARRQPEAFQLRLAPVDPPPGLLPESRIVPVTVEVGYWWWIRILWWLRRWWWLLLLVLVVAAVVTYLATRLLRDGLLPWETPLAKRIGGRTSPSRRLQPGALRTSEGPIPLAEDEVTLGSGGHRLTEAAATVSIQRDGQGHVLHVRKGHVSYALPVSTVRVVLKEADSRRLEHGATISLPYAGDRPAALLVYDNPTLARRSR